MNFIFQIGKESISGGTWDSFEDYIKTDLNYSLDCFPSIEIPQNSNKDLIIKWVFNLTKKDHNKHELKSKYRYSIINEGTNYNIEDLNIIIDESFTMFKKDLDKIVSEKNIDIQIESISDVEKDIILTRLTEALLPLVEPRDI